MGDIHLPEEERGIRKQIRKFKMSLSFKVTLIQEKEEETRRFVLNEDTASRFSDLEQKITSIFPALDQREPVVSWLDEEGDEVRMANDEETKLALAAMTGPVFKLRVRMGGKKDGEQQAGEGHPGIVCDGCDGPVLGPRYKCLVCADYDLCKNCEGRGLHSQHKMVRLPQPCKRDTRGLVRCPLMMASSSACNNQAMGMPGVFLTHFQGSQLIKEQLPQLGGLISTFLGPAALEAVFPVLEALAKTQSFSQRPSSRTVRQSRRRPEKAVWKRRKRARTSKLRKKSEDMDVEKSDDEEKAD